MGIKEHQTNHVSQHYFAWFAFIHRCQFSTTVTSVTEALAPHRMVVLCPPRVRRQRC